MGYYINCDVVDGDQKDRLLDFMDDHYVPAHEFIDEVEFDYDCTRDGLLTDFAYGDGPNRVGFRYSPSGFNFAVHYCRVTLYWVAVQVGRRKVFPDIDEEDPLPYHIYDDQEEIPVIPQKYENEIPKDHNYRFYIVNEIGFRPKEWYVKREMGDLTEQRECEINALMHDQLKRLDRKWKETV